MKSDYLGRKVDPENAHCRGITASVLFDWFAFSRHTALGTTFYINSYLFINNEQFSFLRQKFDVGILFKKVMEHVLKVEICLE